MKSLIIAALATAGVSAAAPALAQTAPETEPTLTAPQGYVTLGYTYLNPYGRDLGELTGRMGLRFSKWWGVEGEVGGGILGNHFGVNGTRANLGEGIDTAVYGVIYAPFSLPFMHGKIDFLARGGYGETPLQTRLDAPSTGATNNSTISAASWNYGAGVQYALDGKNGVRFDYTRRDVQAVGFDNPKDFDTYSFSLVHRF